MNTNIDALGLAEKIYGKVSRIVKMRPHIIPYSSQGGTWDDCSRDISWWTNGFYAGLLWQLHAAFGDETLRDAASEIENKLDAGLLDAGGMDHDSGFKWLLTSGANYALYNEKKSRDRLITAANNLAGRVNVAGGYIRAWNDGGDGERAGIAIIDCMMNLPLLYRASEITHDPRFAKIADLHAQTAAKEFVRRDGSCCHIVEFDPDSGKRRCAHGGQGYDAGSAWTRGQAWGLYGFTLAYLHTHNSLYLDTAKRVADFFISHIPESGLIPIDFRQPESCTLEDCSAAAIAASGLIELGKATGSDTYTKAAVKPLTSLTEKRCDFSEENEPIVKNCAVDFHGDGHNISLIYADYYYTEAILKLCGKGIFLW